MVSHLFVYQLTLVVLVWLFVMLYVMWSKPGLPAHPCQRRPSANAPASPNPLRA